MGMPAGWRVAKRIAATRIACVLAAILAGLTLSAAPAQAQQLAPLVPELRADLISGRQTLLQLAAGAQMAAGTYARVSLDAGIGPRISPHDSAGALSGRVDLIARFLLDPSATSRYGLSVGGGLGVLFRPAQRGTPVVIVAAELEGPRTHDGGWVPALQVGLGGGARVGVVFRPRKQGQR